MVLLPLHMLLLWSSFMCRHIMQDCGSCSGCVLQKWWYLPY